MNDILIGNNQKKLETLDGIMPNSIIVYVEPFMFTQKVFLICMPTIEIFELPNVTEKELLEKMNGAIIKEVDVSMSKLPEFILEYNLKEIRFQGDVVTAKKIVHDCEELEKKRGTFGQTRYLFDDIH